MTRTCLSVCQAFWFKSYLSNRQQRYAVGVSISKPRSIAFSVPQRSILGPLFVVHQNLYADDTFLNAASQSTSGQLLFRLNEDFKKYQKLVISKQAKPLNVAKTEYMFLSTDFRLSNLGKTLPIIL